jgi:hypothetical protein
LSFHCFENRTVLHAIQSVFSDRNVLLFIVLRIALFDLLAAQSHIVLTYAYGLIVRLSRSVCPMGLLPQPDCIIWLNTD